MNFNTVGGRRFALAAGAGCMSSFLVWFAKITPDAYSMIVIATVGAYIAGGTFEAVKKGQ